MSHSVAHICGLVQKIDSYRAQDIRRENINWIKGLGFLRES